MLNLSLPLFSKNDLTSYLEKSDTIVYGFLQLFVSRQLLPKFYLDVQPIFTSISLLSGQACLLFKVISSPSVLDPYPFLSTRSGAIIGHLPSSLPLFT